MSASLPSSSLDWAFLVHAFGLHGVFTSSRPTHSGHINDTFVVELDQAGTRVRYIFQRINDRIFMDVPALMGNISRVTAYARERLAAAGAADVSRRSLTLVFTRGGLPCCQDEQGSWWRCYLFIENASAHDTIGHPRQAREAARAFGEFQKLLVDLPGSRLHETIPFFHHTRRRFDRLRQVIAADPAGRCHEVPQEIAFSNQREPMVDRLLDLQARGDIPERITHNDTKLNNVMLDDATGEGLCIIDLDTVMPGLALYDFGDMVRTAATSAAEDEIDLSKVGPRLPIFEALAEGYLSAAGDFLNPVERAQLVFAGRLITYEQGIRFLIDHLEGDIYYKIHRPDHNLHRARNQFELLRQLELQAGPMEAIVARHSPR